jgi:hypothetical protein
VGLRYKAEQASLPDALFVRIGGHSDGRDTMLLFDDLGGVQTVAAAGEPDIDEGKVGSPTLRQRDELWRRRHDPDHLVPFGFNKSAKALGEEELILRDRDAEAPLSRHPHAPLLDKRNVVDR